MSLVILFLSALWDVEGVRTAGGVVNLNVPKFPSVPDERNTGSRLSQKFHDFPEGVLELLSSSDLISGDNSNHNGKTNGTESSGRTLVTDHRVDFFQKVFPPGSSIGQISSNLNVAMRLQKLDYYFSTLGIREEDCKYRALCELAKDPAKFSPLAIAFLDETRFIGDEKSLARRLLNSEPGTKLLSYIEATLRGNRRNGCEVYMYRCPQHTESMINYQTLLFWREMSKWLTVKMVTRVRA